MSHKCNMRHRQKIMYRIKNDKRVTDSAALLCEALYKCMQDKAMQDITVSELCSVAGVGRATFYRIFDTPVDVLTYASDLLCERIIKDYAAADLESRDSFILYSLKYWRQHYQILEAMFNCNRMDIIRRSLEKCSRKLVPEVNKFFSEKETDYLRAFAGGIMESILHTWLSHGKTDTPEEIYRIYKKICTLAIDSDMLLKGIYTD